MCYMFNLKNKWFIVHPKRASMCTIITWTFWPYPKNHCCLSYICFWTLTQVERIDCLKKKLNGTKNQSNRCEMCDGSDDKADDSELK